MLPQIIKITVNLLHLKKVKAPKNSNTSNPSVEMMFSYCFIISMNEEEGR